MASKKITLAGGETPSRVKIESGEILTFDDNYKFVEKHSYLKRFNSLISAEMRDIDFKISYRLNQCGAWLELRHYLVSGNVNLTKANFCNIPLMCPCCSAARSRRLLARWIPVFQSNTNLYLVTLTWPPLSSLELGSRGNEADNHSILGLKSNLSIGHDALRKMFNRARKRGTGAFKNVLGGVFSAEVTYNKENGWHPHLHGVISCSPGTRVNARELRDEWFSYTGGHSIDLKYLKDPSNVIEAFKYTVKPLELNVNGDFDKDSVLTRYKIYQALKGSRLIRSYGAFYGIRDILDLNSDSVNHEPGDWFDLFFRWDGYYYNLIERNFNASSRADKDFA